MLSKLIACMLLAPGPTPVDHLCSGRGNTIQKNKHAPNFGRFQLFKCRELQSEKHNPCYTKDQADPRKLATNLDRDQIRVHTSHQKSMPKRLENRRENRKQGTKYLSNKDKLRHQNLNLIVPNPEAFMLVWDHSSSQGNYVYHYSLAILWK